MRNLILSITVVLLLATGSSFMVSCDNSNTNNKQTEQEEHSKGDMKAQEHETYACPMHPEITGKKEDKCSKCGMKLTVLVEGSGLDGHNHD